MNKTIAIRIALLPLGILKKLCELAIEGARDLHNIFRFRDAIIDRSCCIDKSSTVGESSRVMEGSFVLGSSIGRYSYLGKESVMQNARVGSFCSIGNEVIVGPGDHPLDYISTSPVFYRKRNTLRATIAQLDADFQEYRKVEIGDDVWIGARAIVLGGVKIGSGAVIAASSVVTKDVPPYAIVGGVPARIIRFRFDKERIDDLIKSEWWGRNLEGLRRIASNPRDL